MGKFRAVDEGELMLLAASLEPYMPISSQMLNIVLLKAQGHIKAPTMVDLLLYEDTEHSPWLDPFVISFQHPNIHSEYCIVLRPPLVPTAPMIRALENFLDWDQIHIFSAIPQGFFDNHLKRLFQKHRRNDEWKDYPCEAYILDHNLAMSYPKEHGYVDTTGDSVEMRPLLEQDADQVLRNYDWARPHSKIHVELAIRNIGSCGAYVTSRTSVVEEESLASSAIISPIGLLNILYTEIPFRRRGLGVEVLKSLGKKAAEIGLTPRAECEIWNDASRQLQMKAGFTFVDFINWVVFKPRN